MISWRNWRSPLLSGVHCLHLYHLLSHCPLSLSLPPLQIFPSFLYWFVLVRSSTGHTDSYRWPAGTGSSSDSTFLGSDSPTLSERSGRLHQSFSYDNLLKIPPILHYCLYHENVLILEVGSWNHYRLRCFKSVSYFHRILAVC